MTRMIVVAVMAFEKGCGTGDGQRNSGHAPSTVVAIVSTKGQMSLT